MNIDFGSIILALIGTVIIALIIEGYKLITVGRKDVEIRVQYQSSLLARHLSETVNPDKVLAKQFSTIVTNSFILYLSKISLTMTKGRIEEGYEDEVGKNDSIFLYGELASSSRKEKIKQYIKKEIELCLNEALGVEKLTLGERVVLDLYMKHSLDFIDDNIGFQLACSEKVTSLILENTRK